MDFGHTNRISHEYLCQVSRNALQFPIAIFVRQGGIEHSVLKINAVAGAELATDTLEQVVKIMTSHMQVGIAFGETQVSISRGFGLKVYTRQHA